MSTPARVLTAAVLLAATAWWCHAPTQAASWPPVNSAELTMAAPKLDKDADAEIMVWEVRVSDELRGQDLSTVYEHYLRVKIFTERGREAFASVDVPHYGNVRIYNVEARTIAPDGTVAEVTRADIRTRDLVRAGGARLKALTFPLPGVVRGSLVEYRWRETHDDTVSNYLRLSFQREYPIHSVTYRVKPLALQDANIGMRGQPFNGTFGGFDREGDHYRISVNDVPAFHGEAYSPSEWALKPWVLLYYRERGGPATPDDYWAQFGRDAHKAWQKGSAVNASLRDAAAPVAQAATLDDKIAALLQIIRTRITRIDLVSVSTGKTERRKPNENAADTWKRGEGNAGDVRELFLALAKAAGLDARVAYGANRDDVPHDPKLMLSYLLDPTLVAVRSPSGWQFLDPANHFAEAGHLSWRQEGQPVLVPDSARPEWATTPTSPATFSRRRRIATLTLAEDGTLEGDVRCEYTGHAGLGFKQQDFPLSPEERVKQYREDIERRLAGAELSQIAISHVDDPDKPYTAAYHVRVPGYAQKTGTRLFLVPAFFQKGLTPEFTAARRWNPLMFPYAWTEVDEIQITLPEGHELEAADRPSNVVLKGVADLTLDYQRDGAGSRLICRRQLTFGAERRLGFAAQDYHYVKGFFDAVRKADDHTLTVRRKGGDR